MRISVGRTWGRLAGLALLLAAVGPVAVAQTARPAPGPAAAQTRCDATCVRQNADRAVQACVPRIEAEAPGDYDWIHRPSGSIFQEADTPEQSNSAIVRYRGDFVRFMSPQREWMRVIYECGFDADAKMVAYVAVRVGVLGKPSPVPAAPTAQVARPPGAPPRQTANGAAPPVPDPAAPQSDVRRINEPSGVDVRQVAPGTKPKT